MVNSNNNIEQQQRWKSNNDGIVEKQWQRWPTNHNVVKQHQDQQAVLWLNNDQLFLWAHRYFLWQLSRDGNLHGSGMSHATTASPKSSFWTLWRVGDAVVGRRNAGWTTSKSGHPWPCENCWQCPPAEKTGIGSLCPSPSPDDLIGQGTELNWIE